MTYVRFVDAEGVMHRANPGLVKLGAWCGYPPAPDKWKRSGMDRNVVLDPRDPDPPHLRACAACLRYAPD